ncbi:IS5 family transposase [Mycobacterium sp. AZCC_0083]|uniref:IS5 family transposase n=1 Tax=Mycobacterium sp. AZCC_0083 TaxID=2735882 RepID=UPI0035CA17C0
MLPSPDLGDLEPLHHGWLTNSQSGGISTRACLLNVNGVVPDAGWAIRTDVVSDELWALIEPLMPCGRRRGRPWNDHRRTLEGVIWRCRTGSPWRDLPEQFGAWQSVAERHLRWSTDGTYARIFTVIQHSLDDGDAADLQELLSVDSTSVRVHQHGAGARPGRDTGGSVTLGLW